MKRDLRKILSENIVAYREENGLSQDAFAALAGVHRIYIGSVERCERNVTLATLELLARAMRKSVPDLLTDRGAS